MLFCNLRDKHKYRRRRDPQGYNELRQVLQWLH